MVARSVYDMITYEQSFLCGNEVWICHVRMLIGKTVLYRKKCCVCTTSKGELVLWYVYLRQLEEGLLQYPKFFLNYFFFLYVL